MNRFQFDQKFPGNVLGIDEVGVGCIAGPLVACGLILPEDPTLIQILLEMDARDSKQMTDYARRRIREVLDEHRVWYFVRYASAKEFERRSMPQLLDLLFRRIILRAEKEPGVGSVIIDGSQDRDVAGHRFHAIPKADDKSLAVACASIVAKTWRDSYMDRMHSFHPQYEWNTNKGYPTKAHKSAVKRYGIVPGQHRTAFKAVKRLIASHEEHQAAVSSGEASRLGPRASSSAIARQLRSGTGRFH